MNDIDNTTEQKQTRREMCRSLLRYSVLGGIGLLWAGLYARSAHNVAPSSCPGTLSCGGCAQFEKCNLPQAEDVKNKVKKPGDNSANQPEQANREEGR